MDKHKPKFGWWVEIQTDEPMCIYYFGVFYNFWEADYYKKGYILDLEQEKAKIVHAETKHCQPEELTIYLGWRLVSISH